MIGFAAILSGGFSLLFKYPEAAPGPSFLDTTMLF